MRLSLFQENLNNKYIIHNVYSILCAFMYKCYIKRSYTRYILIIRQVTPNANEGLNVKSVNLRLLIHALL